MQVKVLLFGGLEAWTPDRKSEQVLEFPDQNSATVLECIRKFATERLELVGQKHFVYEVDGALFLRPGIIVLINETDWEFLEDDEQQRLKHPLRDQDVIQFISTLHGG